MEKQAKSTTVAQLQSYRLSNGKFIYFDASEADEVLLAVETKLNESKLNLIALGVFTDEEIYDQRLGVEAADKLCDRIRNESPESTAFKAAFIKQMMKRMDARFNFLRGNCRHYELHLFN